MSATVEREYLETGPFSREVGVAAETTRWWVRHDKITPAARTSTGRLLFSREQVDEIRARREARQHEDEPPDAA